MTYPPMRPQLELLRVHNLLRDVLSDEALIQVVPPEFRRPLMMAVDCLCWALHHEGACSHARDFGDFIRWIEQDLAELGLTWEARKGKYIVEED